MNKIINKIINNCLLAGDRFMPETHLRQPIFTYSACVSLTKIIKNKKINKQETQDTFIKIN